VPHPRKLTQLIGARRRELNGSFFATLYALSSAFKFWARSSHPVGRKLVVSCSLLLQLGQLVLDWFWLGSLWLVNYYALHLFMPNTAFARYR
jgi:chitin synthase